MQIIWLYIEKFLKDSAKKTIITDQQTQWRFGIQSQHAESVAFLDTNNKISGKKQNKTLITIAPNPK